MKYQKTVLSIISISLIPHLSQAFDCNDWISADSSKSCANSFVNLNPSESNNQKGYKLFEQALNLPITAPFYLPIINSKGNPALMQRIDLAKAKIQKEAMELAIQMGTDLNHFIETQHHDLPLHVLYTQKEFFLDHLSPNNFIKLILKTDLDPLIIDPKKQDKIDEIFARQQSELLQLANNHGADLNEIFDDLVHSINIKTLYSNKEFLLKELGPSKFLILVIHPGGEINDYEYALELELAQLSLDLHADSNFSTNGVSVTLSQSFENSIELLELLVKNGAKHTDQSNRLNEMLENDLAHIILNPQFILDQKYKNLNATEAPQAKMPYMLHHIWLTHPSSPKEIQDVDIGNVITTKALFSQAPVEWQHIVWTNDPHLFPESVTKLEQAGIHVKSIYEHQENLKLFSLIESLIDKKLWGQASDTLRIAIIEYLGGVYSDLNYIFHRHVTSETHKYNFFTSTYKDAYIANFFFGCSPGHPILRKTLSLIERNLLSPPTYLKSVPKKNLRSITSLTTANPIYFAYYSQANQNGNIDVIYPSTSYQRKSKMDSKYPKTQATKPRHPNSDKAHNILKTICPMIHFYDYIQSNEICASEIHFIGYDSPQTLTWLSP